MSQQKNVSEATADLIDKEVRRLIEEGEAKARHILTTQIADLHKIAKALLEYETLSGEEVHALLRGEEIRRDDPENPPKPPPAVVTRKTSVPSSLAKPEDDLPPGVQPQPG